MNEEKVVISSCPHDCGGRCVLKVHVRDGVITRIDTDDGEEPQLRACVRGRAYRQRVYAPDRLKYPMKRTGERGEGKFERITWDEALDTVASELKRVKETYGPTAIFYLPYSGNTGTFLHSQLAVFRLLTMFGGFTPHWGSASFWGSLFSSQVTYGTITTGHTRDDLLNSRLIIMWGWNPAETVLITGTSFYLTQAKEKGIKIVSVDPRFTDSAAAFAGQWIPIRPGTDTAMLVAMAYVIITGNLQDQKFLDRYTVGFERFREYVLGKEDGVPKTPAWAQEITGVPGATIESLAKEYATMKPAALMCTGAPGRTAFGEQFHRALSTLAAITGNLGMHGGDPAGFGFQPVGLQAMTGTGLISGLITGNLPEGTAQKKGVHITKVWDAILKGKAGGYPDDFKLAYITNGNALNQFPNSNKGAEALKKPEFVVVHEQFLTPTARFADILFPVNTHLERNDIIRPWFSGPWYIYMNKAIESLYESKSDLEICAELARRLGIEGYSDKTEDEWLRGFWKASEEMSSTKPLVDYDTLKKKGVHKIPLKEPVIAFKEQIENPEKHPFPTPSGKIEIYSERLAAMNNPKLPPIPKYLEPWEGRSDPLTKKYPLQLITTHFKRRIHSQFDNIQLLKELEPQEVWISSTDAGERDIRHGDMVRIFNDRGEVVIPARVTERIMPGVVSIYQGAWFNPDKNGADRGGCANVLTKDDHSPAGAFCGNNALVQVEKA
ncbi:MAG TPA: molybdopterin-dependent oxidoreductase [Thermodesulfobacteriota bacterium]|nr:molybdopterin-dependent oxidoreductase [Thermodesulfobacteriota bacterium]